MAITKNSTSKVHSISTIPLKAVLLLTSTLTVMSGATIAPSLPQMAVIFQDVPNSAFLSKLILTLPALTIALFSPIAGFLADRYGRLKVLFPALIIYAFAGSLGFFVADLYIILIGRAVLGIAVACIMTIAITLIGDYFQGAEMTKFIGMQAAFMSLGGAVFVGLGGYLADINWSYPFLIYLFSLVVLILGVIYLIEPTRKHKNDDSQKLSFLVGINKISIILITALVSMVIFYMLPVQLPFYLKEIGIEKNSMAGLAIACCTIASSITGFSYGNIRRKLSISWVFVLVFGLMALGFFLISQSNSYSAIIVAMVFNGFGLGMLMPNVNTWLLFFADEKDRGRFSGLLSSAFFMGQFLSPIILMPLVNSYGLAITFLITAISLLSFAIFFLVRLNYQKN